MLHLLLCIGGNIAANVCVSLLVCWDTCPRRNERTYSPLVTSACRRAFSVCKPRSMALLYEKSATWRWLVQQARRSTAGLLRVSGAFIAIGMGTGVAIYAFSEWFSGGAEVRAANYRAAMRHDPEAKRYADHSRDALRALFAQRADQQTVEPETSSEKSSIALPKIPRVAWHPKADPKPDSCS
jgi:hypothetical protein